MPASRTLSQILTELDNTYKPQIQSVRERQALIPGQIKAEEQGLQAKQGQAFDEILGGARRRGLGFSGIPLAEQAKYTSTEFLPAMARLKQSGREQVMSLEDAILAIQERKNQFGQSIFQQEQDRAEQIRQFNVQEAARRQAAAAQTNTLSGLFGGAGGAVNRPSLDDIFGNYNPNAVPLGVTSSRGSTVPLSVAKSKPQPRLSVGKSRSQPTLGVR